MRIGKAGIYSPERKICLVKRVTLGYQITAWERGETLWLCRGRPWWLSRRAPALQHKAGEPPCLRPGAELCALGLVLQGGKGPAAAGAPQEAGTAQHRRSCPPALTAPRQGRSQPLHGAGGCGAGQGRAGPPGLRPALASRSRLGGPRGGLPLCSRAPWGGARAPLPGRGCRCPAGPGRAVAGAARARCEPRSGERVPEQCRSTHATAPAGHSAPSSPAPSKSQPTWKSIIPYSPLIPGGKRVPFSPCHLKPQNTHWRRLFLLWQCHQVVHIWFFTTHRKNDLLKKLERKGGDKQTYFLSYSYLTDKT